MTDTETELAIDVDFRQPLANPEAEAAVRCASRAARRFWIGLRAFRASITSIDSDVEAYQRALHQFERRTVSLRTLPGGSRHDLAPIPDPEAIDPWAVAPTTIETDSRVNAVCPTCNGSMRVTCDNCDGTTRARCGNCDGSGRVFSQRKNQVYKNCPRCRGGGTVKCTDCRGGFVDCSHCGASGVITAWLSIERAMQMQVQVHPQNSASAIHVNVESSSDFDSSSFPNSLMNDTGTQPPTIGLPIELAPVLNAVTDRLHTTRVQKFEGRVYHVCYANAVAAGQVDVVGSPLAVSNTTNWEALRWRRSSAILTALLGIIAVVILRFVHVAQHEWYARFESGAFLVFGGATAISLGWLVARLTHAPRARSGVGLSLAIAATLCGMSLTVAAYFLNQPSAASARAALARGAVEDSRLEAQALIDLNRDKASGETILDDIQARQIASAQTCHEMASLLRHAWRSPALHGQSVERLRSCAIGEASTAFSHGNATALSSLAAEVADTLPGEANGARWLAAMLEACGEVANDRFGAAVTDFDTESMLARDVPVLMRPANFQQLVEAAAALRQSLATAETTNARERKSALTAAIAQTDALVALLPFKWPQPSTALANQLLKVRKSIARSERRAAEHSDEEQPAAQTDATPPPPAPAPKPSNGLLDPY